MRDYIHVDDLAQAHRQALAHVDAHAGAHVFDLGIGQSFSVREVIAAAEAVTGRKVPWDMAPRCAGDPAALVASSDLARRELGWTPRYTSLSEIIETAWRCIAVLGSEALLLAVTWRLWISLRSSQIYVGVAFRSEGAMSTARAI